LFGKPGKVVPSIMLPFFKCMKRVNKRRMIGRATGVGS